MSREEAPFEIRTVAVIGAGEQGRAFALACALAGFATVLEDVMPSKLRRAGQELASVADPGAAGNLSFASAVEDAVRDADVAIDFVPDELESKLEIFSMVDRMAPPRTILCTPTTALSISDLASCTYRAERCIALAAANGEVSGAALTVVEGRATLPWVTEAVRVWLLRLGRDVAVATDDHVMNNVR